MDRSGGMFTLSGWLPAAPCRIEQQQRQTNENIMPPGTNHEHTQHKITVLSQYLLSIGRLGSIRRLGLRIQRQLLQQIRGFFAQKIDELRHHKSVFRSYSFQSKSQRAVAIKSILKTTENILFATCSLPPIGKGYDQ
jgi:hypothetical protein